ncbi:MAG: acyl-CoA dehydrogenase family protein [Gammaproteobacteria bacterium]|nr:acyl-CoA dehydrogenase family protein [Gammaproteobacteria bacterium]
MATRSRWEDEETAAFRDAVARFMDAEMLPQDEAWRHQGHVGHDIWRQVGAQGMLCVDIPETYGGAGGDFRYEAVMTEELSRRGLSGFGLSVHTICAHYILNHGTEAQKQQWLPRMASGELVGAIAMSEPAAGSDLQGVRTRAQRDGDHYIVNGSKIFISNGYLAEILAVVVKTDPAQGAKGTSILMVETKDLPGYRVGRRLDKIGMKAQDTAELFFDDVRVPVDCLLGGSEGQGFSQLMSDLPYERAVVAVAGVAAMEGALEATRAYVHERKAFGKTLFDFQNTKFKLAEVATIVRVARAFIDQCIEDVSTGRLDTVTASMAKLWCTDMQQQVIDDCLQLFGGYGYMNEYLIARMYADARVQRIYGGTNEIMKEVIARSL